MPEENNKDHVAHRIISVAVQSFVTRWLCLPLWNSQNMTQFNYCGGLKYTKIIHLNIIELFHTIEVLYNHKICFFKSFLIFYFIRYSVTLIMTFCSHKGHTLDAFVTMCQRYKFISFKFHILHCACGDIFNDKSLVKCLHLDQSAW